MKLMAAKTENYNGKKSVIVPDDEGNNNASGVGFVVTSPMNNDAVLVNQEFVKIADLQDGKTRVPLVAEYYRYGDSVKPAGWKQTHNLFCSLTDTAAVRISRTAAAVQLIPVHPRHAIGTVARL